MNVPERPQFIFRHARALSRRVLEVIYPRTCPVCDTFHEEERQALCLRCSAALRALENEPFCHRCARPLATEGAPCPWCSGKGLFPLERILRLGEYEDPLHALIVQLKYQRKWTVGELLADRLFELPHVRELLGATDLIVPVPLHWRQQYRRGYNQSAIVGRRLARGHGRRQGSSLRFVQPVRRVRDTESQTRLTSRKAREENVRGAFKLTRPHLVEGRRIVIVDDVSTTGATLRSLARALNEASPASISAIVLAVADPKRRDFTTI